MWTHACKQNPLNLIFFFLFVWFLLLRALNFRIIYTMFWGWWRKKLNDKRWPRIPAIVRPFEYFCIMAIWWRALTENQIWKWSSGVARSSFRSYVLKTWTITVTTSAQMQMYFQRTSKVEHRMTWTVCTVAEN